MHGKRLHYGLFRFLQLYFGFTTTTHIPIYVPKNVDDFLFSFKRVLHALFVDQFRWIVTSVGLIGFFKNFKKLKRDDLINTYIIGMLTMVVVFTLMGELLYRYFLPFYPLVIIVLFYFSTPLFKKEMYQIGVALFAAGLFSLAWHPQNKVPISGMYRINSPEDMRYKDIIYLGVKISDFVTSHYPNAFVYGAIPENYQLSEPFQGYSSQPIQFDFCHYYKPQPDKTVLIIHHLYSPLQPACEQLLKRLKIKPIQRFEQNGFWANMYQVDYQ